MVKRQIPQVVQEANVYINGQGYLGVVKSLTIPKIEQEMVEMKGALSGNFASGSIKAVEMEFKLNILDKNMFLGYGLNTWKNRIPFLFKASIFQAGREPMPFSMAVTGDIIEIDPGSFESGKEMEVNVKLAVHFLDLNIDKIPMIVFDVENMICLIGGVDYLAKVRSNLSE
ncbi:MULTISPECIES: phage major tail tube protein [Campylobacter]|jgi:phage tail tube protein FII|uniref:phage major tail tube protein n=1 Tax=Campylobacter TaxID=194 RepID=UPI00027A359D|nr:MULTISPECIES: phage major tail tube protein [Campylobacter]EJP75096.1 phage tail tube protein FII [Campylobacter sp. FOBRC14]MBN7287462.1 phage major tail tube protein [Campylobacter curvus]MDU6828085.1 phage major tail tube protein [Campylobacter sp.]DAX24686.1 MAG TPA: tail tube protein [Caudoviricetes sp.]